MADEQNDRIDIVVNRIKEIASSLSMSRVPEKTKSDFKKLAFNEFAGDYGATLKYLMDNLITLGQINYLLLKVDELENKFNSFKQGDHIKAIKTLAGTELIKGGKQE